MFLAVMQPLLHGKCFTIVNIFQISSMAHQCEQYSTLELQSFNPGGGTHNETDRDARRLA